MMMEPPHFDGAREIGNVRAMSQPPLSPANAAATQAQIQRALTLARAGSLREAITILRELRSGQPAHIPLRCLLGVLLQEDGDNAAALRELDEAATLAPQDAAVHETRASVLLALDRFVDAERAARAALALDPQRPRAQLSLGLALEARGHNNEAIAVLHALVAQQPHQLLARRTLARALLRIGDAAAALAVATHRAVLDDVAQAQVLVGDFCASATHAQTIALLEALLVRHPTNYTFIISLARTLHQAARSSQALEWSERAHALAPDAIEPVEMRAVALLDRGDVDAGLALYHDLLVRTDLCAESANRYLILAHYDPAQDNNALYAAHADWVRRFVQPFGAPFHDDRAYDPQRRLRIGWLSPRFSDGPVASFFTGLLAAFDRDAFEHALVALHESVDTPANARLRELADEWIDAHAFDDEALLQNLRDRRFDIVIDLAGHSFGNRLRVLAQRIAPIQLCWLDYFNTTAVGAMDGWISDAWLTPEHSPQLYSERVLRLASGRFCYTPSADAPEPVRSGAGPVVFSSFNRLAKCNDAVLDAWAAILKRVPDAQLKLGAHLLGDAVARARTLERFAQRGIDAARLRLSAQRSYAELLAAYRHVDIALDPFPFSGCTTTCDALWMGVPVITRRGSTFVARQSASLLSRLGREQWIAHDAADYVERAVATSDRLDDLRRGRAALRELTRTKLCDATAQAHDFAALLRALWVERCRAP
jgi:protein O-GlcNAc transferase